MMIDFIKALSVELTFFCGMLLAFFWPFSSIPIMFFEVLHKKALKSGKIAAVLLHFQMGLLCICGNLAP